MGILEQMFERRDATLSLKDYQQWVDAGIVEQTASGVSVTPNKAMHHAAVFACVRILSGTIASLPLIMYERLERGKRRATDHPLYEVLKERPNEGMTSFEYRETLQSHLLLWGNAYSLIVTSPNGQVAELLPLQPDSMMEIVPRNGRQVYHYLLPTGEPKWFDESIIWHQRGLGSNGRIGYSVVSMMRQAIGLGMAAEEYGARFFANDATAGITLEHPGKLSPDARKNLRESWENAHTGLSKKHRVAILEEGMKATKITVPPNDAQWLETRRHQIAEFARAFGVPLALLEEHDKAATYASVEQFMLSFVVHGIRPWTVRWEQSIKHSLMLKKDRARFFPEHLVDALLRGDIKTRYEAYAMGRQWGWYSANDIRELENENPIPGKGGDVYLVPLNMVPSSQAQEPAADSSTDGAARSEARSRRLEQVITYRLRLSRGYLDNFREAAGRVIHFEADKIRQHAGEILPKGTLNDLSRWLDRFYEDRSFIRTELQGIYEGYAAVVTKAAAEEVGSKALSPAVLQEFLHAYVRVYAARHARSSKNQVEQLLRDTVNASGDLMEALELRLDEWEATRAGKIALEETVRAGNALAKLVYVHAGMPAVRWNYTGHGCVYCGGLHNKIIRIDANFVEEGHDYQPEGAEAPLAPGSSIGHPPLHGGCECLITAEAALPAPTM